MIDGKIDSLVFRMDRMSERLDKHAEQIDMTERRVTKVAEAQSETDLIKKQMAKALMTLQDKAEDLEARSRRSNIRITDFPESTSMGNMEQFKEKFLFSMLGLETFSDMFVVERAHRSLGPRPLPGAPPRPMIVKLLNHRDAALMRARELGELQYEGSAISLYLDFTMKVQEARRQFSSLKRQLHDQNIEYAMLFPARLRVTLNGKARIFSDPKSLQKALKDFSKKVERDAEAGRLNEATRGASGGGLDERD